MKKNSLYTYIINIRIYGKMARLFLLLLLGIPLQNFAYQEVPVTAEQYTSYRGEIVDSETNKPLVFATITLEGTNISTVTNTEGGFLLKVPSNTESTTLEVSFLGYRSKTVPLASLNQDSNKIELDVLVTELPEVKISVPREAITLVKETLRKKGENYLQDPSLMTAFYRETIKKRRRNVSLSEAVVSIYKTPYSSSRRDAVQMFKSRKSTDYSKLDTLVLKLQGGPFNALYVDVMKYPEYIFTEQSIDDYVFKFDRSTRINDRLIYVISFNQRENILDPLYRGELYIDVERKVLTSAIYSLNITDRVKASRLFVRKKPRNAEVYPVEVAYRVDYREKDGRWYYGYSNALLEFKIDWDKKLFNSVYSMTCEMAVTDWERNTELSEPRYRDRLKSTMILSDEASGFSDPDFWGEYNIIEPEKSIESAIKKIQRQLRKQG
ncbi:carboxypeptidase-like regulatory domain-containing protein [Muriicola soli]|uniref:Carboxypeptidase-like regulatory domain-containing protein n=1 Tax=Muriicola soli TaxID=2507538 RepID=A0A411E845_9FLAO|nr:carboxypeptidase-like regulatory domain-containing protein [Muriicola soli]QBA63693.1 carboxypeptidase-like regulatory domain-containing protein [Muriicola soli]